MEMHALSDDAKKAAQIELAELAAKAQSQFLRLAAALLDSDLILCSFGPGPVERATAARARGRQITLEVVADEHGAPVVSLLAASGSSRERIATMTRPLAN